MHRDTPTAFFSKTFDEATSLLIEARDYIALEERADRGELESMGRLRLTCETTRLTSRITHIMAWLFGRKAVFTGEITLLEATRPPYRLERNEILADGNTTAYEGLPEMLVDLMNRSHRLYIRVSRLDELVQRDMDGRPTYGG